MKYLIMFLLFPCLAFSQTITEINGEITHEGYVSVTGTEFGVNPNIEMLDHSPKQRVEAAESSAGILLGNHSEYTKCTVTERMIVTAWAPSSITAQIMTSSFTPGERAYVFVIDDKGSVSAGYPVEVTDNGALGRPGVPTLPRFINQP